jgi:hypothetical protein
LLFDPEDVSIYSSEPRALSEYMALQSKIPSSSYNEGASEHSAEGSFGRKPEDVTGGWRKCYIELSGSVKGAEFLD